MPKLWMAAQEGAVNDVVQLIEAGVDINEQAGVDEYSPLHIAVEKGRADVVEILLEHGATLSRWDRDGRSALHLACSGRQLFGRMAIIKSLLKHGADVNHEDYEGFRPINSAILSTSIPAIKLLLKRGGDISLQNDNGLNALHWAVQCHYEKVAGSLNRAMKYPLRPVDNRGVAKAVQVIQTLITHTHDVHTLYIALCEHDAVGGTAEDFADNGDEYVEVVEILRSALLRAQEKRLAMLEAVIMGQHVRLGVASRIVALSPDVVQMIIDRV